MAIDITITIPGAVVEWMEGSCLDEPDIIMMTDENGLTEIEAGRHDRYCINIQWTDGLGLPYSGQLEVDELEEYTVHLEREKRPVFMPLVMGGQS